MSDLEAVEAQELLSGGNIPTGRPGQPLAQGHLLAHKMLAERVKELEQRIHELEQFRHDADYNYMPILHTWHVRNQANSNGVNIGQMPRDFLQPGPAAELSGAWINYFQLAPWWIGPCLLTGLTFMLNVAGSEGSIVRAVIYKQREKWTQDYSTPTTFYGPGTPGELLASSDDIDATVTGIKITTFSDPVRIEKPSWIFTGTGLMGDQANPPTTIPHTYKINNLWIAQAGMTQNALIFQRCAAHLPVSNPYQPNQPLPNPAIGIWGANAPTLVQVEASPL